MGAGAATNPKGIKMIRNLKALGLALVAFFAFSAVAASGASAQGKLTAPEPVTLIGTETGTTFDNALSSFGGKTHCPGSTITGHKITTTPHGLIPSGATEVTLTPHYVNCVSEDVGGSKFPTTVDMNGCDYHGKLLGSTTGATGSAWGINLQITCPPNAHIQITQFSSSSHALRVCTVTVTNTNLTSDAHIGNVQPVGQPDHLWAAGKVTNVSVHKSGLCGSGSDPAGVFNLDLTIKAFNGVQKDVTIS
jgi:hypothetical protein